MKKRKLILSWVLRVLVALGFLAASLGKLTNNPSVIKMFEDWGFPKGFHFIIGMLELLLAVMLVIPKTLKISIYGITIILVGATITHLINDPLNQLLRPLIFLVITAIIFYLNFIKKE